MTFVGRCRLTVQIIQVERIGVNDYQDDRDGRPGNHLQTLTSLPFRLDNWYMQLYNGPELVTCLLEGVF